jgi:hypothetical protein
VDYGLPGKAGYGYSKPFDYFHFEVGGLSIPTTTSIARSLAGCW